MDRARGSPRITLVHDWLVGMRGGERVLEELCRLFPDAPLYTFFHRPGSVSAEIERHPIRASLLNRLPYVHRYYRLTLPVLPIVASAMRLQPCDLVISTSHCVARSVHAPAGAPHLCVCFTPMRYIWGMEEAYLGRGFRRRVGDLVSRPLRAWDRSTHSRVDRFIAISDYVGERIARAYGRESEVIYPPVDTERFRPMGKAQDYFLVVSALVPYKRIDLVVEAFRGRGEELWVVGDGPLLRRLRSMAPPNVRFLGWVDDPDLPGLVARCRALLFPTEDEFGIVPVEAQAAGRPVIALSRGGGRETVVPIGAGDPPTGVWFSHQSAQGVSEALDQFLAFESSFDPVKIRDNALRFSRDRFREKILGVAEEMLSCPG